MTLLVQSVLPAQTNQLLGWARPEKAEKGRETADFAENVRKRREKSAKLKLVLNEQDLLC